MPNYFEQDSVRLAILKYIRAKYQSVTDQTPPPAGALYYGLKFSTVELGPLGPPDARKLSAVGIHVGPEKKADLLQVKNNTMEVNIEFRFTANQSDADTPAAMAERVLGVVQQVMYDDYNLGGLIISFEEVANEIDLVTYADRTVQGLVRFSILYRQTFSNVYTTTPTV